jgi:hypothetical protein
VTGAAAADGAELFDGSSNNYVRSAGPNAPVIALVGMANDGIANAATDGGLAPRYLRAFVGPRLLLACRFLPTPNAARLRASSRISIQYSVTSISTGLAELAPQPMGY